MQLWKLACCSTLFLTCCIAEEDALIEALESCDSEAALSLLQRRQGKACHELCDRANESRRDQFRSSRRSLLQLFLSEAASRAWWLWGPASLACFTCCSCVAVLLAPQTAAPPFAARDLEQEKCSGRHITSLLLSVLLSDLIDAMSMVHFPAAALSRGLTETMIGAVIATGYVPAVLGGSLATRMSRHFSQRQLIATGLFLAALSSLLLSLACSGAGACCALSVVARVVWGLGSLLVNLTSMAVAGEIYEADRSWAAGVINVANGLAYTLGPLLSAASFAVLGFQGTCLLAGAVTALAAWPIYQFIPGGPSQVRDDEATSSAAVLELTSVPSVTLTLLGILLVGVGFASIDATMEVELVRLNAASSSNLVYAGMALSTLSLCNAVASPLVGTLAASSRLGANAIICSAFVLLTLAGAAASISTASTMPHTYHVAALITACGAWGIGSAMVVVPAMDLIAASGGLRGLNTVTALMLTALNSGTIFGSALGSLCAARLGLPSMFGILSLAAAFLGLLMAWRSEASSRSSAHMTGDAAGSVPKSPCMLLYCHPPPGPPKIDLPEPALPISPGQVCLDDNGPSYAMMAMLLGTFLSALVDAMPMVYFPKEAAKWGFDETMTGLVISSGYIPCVFCGRLATAACSQLGHRLTLVLGLLLGASSNAMLWGGPLLASHSTPAAFLLSVAARLVQGVGLLMVSVSTTAIAGALYELDRSWAVGIVQTSQELAYTFGPVAGASLYSLLGFQGVSLLCAAGLAACIWPVQGLVMDVNEQKEPASILEMACQPAVYTTLWLVLLVGMGLTAIQSTMELTLAHADSSGHHNSVMCAGMVLFVMSLCSAAATPLVGRLAAPRRFGACSIISAAPWFLAFAGGVGAVAVATAGLPFLARACLLSLSCGFWGFGTAMVIVPSPEFIAAAFDVQGLEEAAALMVAALNAGTVLGSSVGLFFASHVGYWAPNGLLTVFAMLLGVAWLLASRGNSDQDAKS